MVASALAISAVSLFLGWRLTPQFAIMAAAASLVALVLSRSGRTGPAMALPLLSITYIVLHLAARSGGIENIGLAVLPLLIVLGSVVWNLAMLVCFTAGTLLATMGMLAIRYFVLKAERFSPNDMGDLFIFCITCACAALVGRLLTLRIEESFRRVRDSERRYRGIFENIQDVYCEMSTDGVLLELSPAGSALFGVPREEMVGCPLAEFCASRSEFDALIEALRTHGRVGNRELVVRDSRGEFRTVLVNASLWNESRTGEEKVIGSIRDITDRMLAEEALRDSEARLRLALDATGAGMFDFYPQTGEMIWSEIAKSQFSMSPGTEVDFDMFLRAVHPDDRDRIRQERASISLPGSDGKLASEFRVIGIEDGRERWIAARGRMLFDREARPARLIGTSLDISERKRLEEDLRRRAEELQTIMDVAPVALITAHDPECREVTANRMGKSILELAAEANSPSDPLCSAPARAYFRDGAQVSVKELPLQTAARGVEVRNCELEALLPSGARRILLGHASPLRDAAGRVRGSIAAIQDVTEAKQRADALLRESEERFRNTADAAPVIMWFGDADKRLTFVNEQFVQFTGLASEQLLGHGWEQVIHPDDLEAARAVYYESVERRASYQVEYQARRADGEYRHMLGTTSPRYVGREYAGQVGSVIDITDLKTRQEEDLERQKLESLGVLAAGIAHDFNNLLGSIRANAELAAAEIQGGSPTSDGIETIKAVAERAAGIVRQLMDYAAQEPAAPEEVDMSRLVGDMLDLLRVSISKRASLEVDLGENLPAVRANAAQIRQVILNLVTNASEAIGADRNGLISVGLCQVRLDPAPDTTGGASLGADDYIRLTVSDTGCGMPPEVQARIFDPFYTTKFAGRGLGLAVVQGIVRAHRGTVHVVSTPGTGTRIEVLLPCLDRVAPSAEGAAAVRGSAATVGTVLVVEDEGGLRSAVCKLLRQKGFSVLEAGDGGTAADLFQARHQDIQAILLDMTIPGRSSPEVAAEARRIRPDVKVALTTAYSLETAATSFAEIHLDGYLRKPYRIDDLVKMLSDLLAG
jgi:PAS domain S-box-containing protein